jgi:membrane protease YdiL (CAAX protease family)
MRASHGTAPPSTRANAIAAWPFVACGIVVLMLRVRVLALVDPERIAVLTVIYLGLLLASTAVPVVKERIGSPGRSWSVLAVGLIGLGAAALASGRPAAVPFGPWALPLSLLAAVAEEAFFRRAAYATVDRSAGPTVAVGVTALAFAAIHVPLYGAAAFPVDLGAGLLLGWQRWETGDWTVPAATHAAANLLAVITR